MSGGTGGGGGGHGATFTNTTLQTRHGNWYKVTLEAEGSICEEFEFGIWGRR